MKNPGSSTPQNCTCMITYPSSHKLWKWDEQDIVSTVEEAETTSEATFSYGLLHIDIPVLTEQYMFTFISSVRIQDEDLPRKMVNRAGQWVYVCVCVCKRERERERERESRNRVKEICAISSTWRWYTIIWFQVSTNLIKNISFQSSLL